jgi:transaldolase/glucose-6-phosphate isomerase
LAESTGKEGTGLVPIAHEPLLPLNQYSSDRLFVGYSSPEHRDPELEKIWGGLRELGQPVLLLPLPDTMQLGGELFRWEFATAIAGSILGIDAFDQPNVQESKENTKKVLEQYQSQGRLPDTGEGFQDHGRAVSYHGVEVAEKSLRGAMTALLTNAQSGDFVALMGYLDPSPEHWQLLQKLRHAIGLSSQLPTSLGFGPRFLHSTGQLFKGGPNQGLFLQIVADYGPEVPIPTESFDFRTLILAQALGDYQSLVNHGRRVVRIVISGKPDNVLSELAQAAESIVMK